MNHSLLLKEDLSPYLEARRPESEGGSNRLCKVQASSGGGGLGAFCVGAQAQRLWKPSPSEKAVFSNSPMKPPV